MQVRLIDNWKGTVQQLDAEIEPEANRRTYRVTVDLGRGPELFEGVPAPGKGRLSGRWFDLQLVDFPPSERE